MVVSKVEKTVVLRAALKVFEEVAKLVALLVSERVVNSDILLAFLLEFSMAVCSVALLDRNVVECLDAEMAA